MGANASRLEVGNTAGWKPALLQLPFRRAVKRDIEPGAPSSAFDVRAVPSAELFLNLARKDSPDCCSFSSSFFVQSQSQQAHGSLPFRSRQFPRACASLTLIKSKYSSQYGRSSWSGTLQKHTSTHCAVPSGFRRARCISSRYSSPAIEPLPSVPSSMALRNADSRPGLTRALTHNAWISAT